MFSFGKPNINKLQKKGDIQGLIAAINYEKDALVRANAVYALGELGAQAAVEPILARFNDPDVTPSAVSALGKIGDARAVDVLLPIAADPRSELRLDAIKALGKIGDPRGIPAITSNFNTRSLSGDISDLCVAALVQIGQKHVGALVQAFREPPAGFGQGFLEKAIEQLGAKAVEPLIEGLKNGQGKIPANAAYLLARIGDERALEPLAEAAQQLSDEEGREAASRSLDRLKSVYAPLSADEKDVLKAIVARRSGTLSVGYGLTLDAPQHVRDAADSLVRKGLLTSSISMGGVSGTLYGLTPLGEKRVKSLF